MSDGKELTPWFAASVKPARDGVYEVRPLDRRHLVWHSMWLGGGWRGATGCGAETAVEYAVTFSSAKDAPFEWRGLAKDPS